MILQFTVFQFNCEPDPGDLYIESSVIAAVVENEARTSDPPDTIPIAVIKTRIGVDYIVLDLKRDAAIRWAQAEGDRIDYEVRE